MHLALLWEALVVLSGKKIGSNVICRFMALLAQSILPKPLMHVHYYYLGLKAHRKVSLLFCPGLVSS